MTDQITTNTHELARARANLLSEAGLGLDAKRPTAWLQYGYPEHVSFEMLLQSYKRGGAGHGAVHKLLDGCWLKQPRIKKIESDKETPWEKKLGAILKAAKVWARLKDGDRRSLIGRYAALIYRVADNKALTEPMGRAVSLVELVPVFESQIKVTQWVTDTKSDDYGKPAMFQYRRANLQSDADRQGRPEEWADVHPSRVQLLYEGLSGDFTEGVPLLQAGFNRLIDLEKIEGGSGESFLKNSARTVVFKYDAGATPQAIQSADGQPTRSVKDVHEEQAKALNRSIDASIVMQGGDATTLQTTISDPTGAWTVAANSFAASVRMPFTILFGQQTGRLASDEDKSDFANRCSSRQENQLTPMLEELVQRLQKAGIIEAGEFEVEWPPVNAPTEKDKADLLGKMTSAMQQAYQAGLVEPLFDANELRAVMDYEQRDDDGMPAEGDPTKLDPEAEDA